MKKNKLLICALFVSMILSVLPGTESFAAGETGENAAASEIQDENEQRLEETTAMDKDGSIYEISDSDGTVDEEKLADETVEEEDTQTSVALFSAAAERTADAIVVNFNTKSNAITEFVGDGYTNGAYGADAAYLGTDKNGDIRFMLAGVTASVKKEDVELVEYSQVVDNVSYYKVSGGKLYHYISQNLNKSPSSTINNGPAPSYLKSGVKYYSYDGHYFYSDYRVMCADYQSGSNGKSAVNSGNPFYNYFQFLDMNKSTSYSGDELNSILNTAMKNAGKNPSSSKLTGTGDIFVKYQNQYGVNALLSLGIAINESGWGTSSICLNKNNLFGLNATDDAAAENADCYTSVDECIRVFMDKWMARGYLKDGNWKNQGEFLGNKAEGINYYYASDPYWGEKAAALVWTLDAAGNNKDYLGTGSTDSDSAEPDQPSNDEPSGNDTPSGTDEPSGNDTPSGTDEPSGNDTPSGTDEPSGNDTPSGTDEPSGNDTPSGTDEPSGNDTTSGTDTPSDNVVSTPPVIQQPSNPVTSTPSASQEPPADASDVENDTDDNEDEQKSAVVDRELANLDNKIKVSGKLSSDAVLSVNVISPNTDKYNTYVSDDSVKGKVVLGVYDISISGTLDGEAELTFQVGTEYNGKKVIILHYADDGSCEKYSGTVENGQVTIRVRGFSPYVIALDDGAEDESGVPRTGVEDNMSVWAGMLMLSVLMGTAVLLKRKMHR